MAESWDVFVLGPGGDYEQPEYLATLYNASQQSIRPERKGLGSGSFAINRSAPECTEEILKQGNLVKVRIPEISADYIFAFFLETGDFTLISSEEVGGETLTFGGRGIFSYLEYACAWSESYITGGDSPDAGVWRAYAAGTGSAPGQILRRMIEEMQHADRPQQPLPLLAIDFDYDDDSTADPWDETDATDEFAYQVGETGLAIAQRLIDTDAIVMQMSPDFLLSAYNPENFGRDLTGTAFGAGVVRFERGVNIAIELRRELVVKEASTHMLVGGENDHYARAVYPTAALFPTREAFVASFGVGATALVGVGLAELDKRHLISDQILFPINNRRTADVVLVDPVGAGAVATTPGLATAGYYLPGPEGTNGDFWVGDTVRVHTGSGPFDYNEVDAVVEAINITRRDDNAELDIIVELGSPTPVPLVPSYMTETMIGGCEIANWPEGSPPVGIPLFSFVATRGWPEVYAGIDVPIGIDSPALNCTGTGIGGTGWTFLDGMNGIWGGDNAGIGPCVSAYRISAASEPSTIGWGGFGGTQRPRSHSVSMPGFTGAPTVNFIDNDNIFGSGSSVFTSPNLASPGAGRWIVAVGYGCTGPADGSSTAFDLTARAPAVDLTRGFAYGSFGPYSWMGYLDVLGAGTDNIILDRSAAPRKSVNLTWAAAFWPA